MTYRNLPPLPSSLRIALAIALIYAGVAVAWILYSDTLLAVWVQESARLTQLQTFKGLFFVLSTALLLFLAMWLALRRQAALQRTLSDREAAFQLAMRASGMGVWDYRVGREEVDTSAQVAVLLGYPPETFRDSVAAWQERLHPQDRDMARRRFRAYMEGRAPRYEAEFRMRHRDGGYRWFRSTGQVVERDGDGKPTRVIGAYLDIDEQLQTWKRLAESETRARLYLERMPIGCMITDTDWRIISCNPAFERMFGYGAGELIGRTAFDTIIAESARGQTEVLLARLRSGSFDTHNINENRTRDGRSLLCEWFNTPIRDADGKVVQLLAMAIDITRRDATDRALADSYRHLSELSARLMQVQEDERRRLARELHDEVGQQLTAVKLNLHAIGRVAEDDITRARVDDCVDIVDLTIARIRSRALELRPAMLDDLGLGAALAWYCRSAAERAGVAVELLGGDGLERFDEAVETAAFRIVQEAVNNALRHGPPTRVEVEVHHDGHVLELSIADDGSGFDAAALRNGGGLGLAGMRERTELLGGHFAIDSAPGAGTRIHARLPAPPRAEAD